MGHRSWFTFVASPKDALRLVQFLDQGNDPVDGVNFVVRLNKPYKHMKDKLIAIAWSADGTSSMHEAGPFKQDTYLLDSMGPQWKGDPSKYGTLLGPEDLKAEAAKVADPEPVPMKLGETEDLILLAALTDIERTLADGSKTIEPDDRETFAGWVATGRDFLAGKPVDGTRLISLMSSMWDIWAKDAKTERERQDGYKRFDDIINGLKYSYFYRTVVRV